MKRTCLVLAVIVLLLSCKKTSESPYQSLGVITGVNIYYTCAGCVAGGIEIKIKNDPSKNPPPYYQIHSSLQDLGISPNAKFPINVSLDWKHDTIPALAAANYIIVTKLKVIN